MRRPCRIPGMILFGILLAIAALPARAEERLRMSTTTSTENSGLLSVLLPPFEKKFGCKVDVVAVGTGKALKLAEAGDVDVVFVHARTLEDKFVANGFGVNRRDVMYNDFVVVGPTGDPAGIGKTQSAPEAFRAISSKGSRSSPAATNRGRTRRRRRSGRPRGSSPRAPGTSRRGRGWGRSSRWPPRNGGIPSPTAART